MQYKFTDHLQGDTFDGTVFVITVNNKPLDLTDANVKMSLVTDMKSMNPILTLSTLTKGITITDPEEGKFQIEIKENFFRGEEKTEEEATKIIQMMHLNDSSFNIAGKESVALALKLGIISEESVKTIQGVPFSLILG